MKILIFLFITFNTLNCVAQKLPLQKINEHLEKSGEPGPITESYILKLCGNDTAAIYRFTSIGVDSYKFLLLRKGHYYQILNGNNFSDDWGAIYELYKLISKQIDIDIMNSILLIYIANQNYHPTPPLFKYIEQEKRTEFYYPPRKIIETAPFFY